jgi:hypothetical protein
MRHLTKLIIILIVLIGFSINSRASDDLKADSIKVIQIVEGFYNWYLTAIKEKVYSDYKPKFVESENGMTTLDYSKYIENLTKYRFSDSLIIKEKQSFSDCIENLGIVKFTDFQKTTFVDLDEYEQANCDFGNYYRWIGGQEPIDGIRIKRVKFISTDVALVSIDYFEIKSEERKKHFWGKNSLILKRFYNEWYIDKIDSWRTD